MDEIISSGILLYMETIFEKIENVKIGSEVKCHLISEDSFQNLR
jgi:hypothetical protein